jgi:alpha-D-ribose 1-methylphosphonate 5-phosphate C-P lyase
MAGFGEDDAEVVGTVKLRALTMFDAQRMTLYGTMAGLIDAGLSFSDAAEIVAGEFEGADDPTSAKSVRIFFKAVEEARAAGKGDLRSKAAAAFGAKFICPEEMALVVSLLSAPRPERILEAASRLLELQARTRATSVVGSQQRFVG